MKACFNNVGRFGPETSVCRFCKTVKQGGPGCLDFPFMNGVTRSGGNGL